MLAQACNAHMSAKDWGRPPVFATAMVPAKLCGMLSGTGGKLVSKAWLSKPSELAPAGAGRVASPSLEVVRLPTDGVRWVGEGGMPDVALAGAPAKAKGKISEHAVATFSAESLPQVAYGQHTASCCTVQKKQCHLWTENRREIYMIPPGGERVWGKTAASALAPVARLGAGVAGTPRGEGCPARLGAAKAAAPNADAPKGLFAPGCCWLICGCWG